MTDRQRAMLAKLGLHEEVTKPKDKLADTDAALCELAEMIAANEEAICELAELIGGE